MRVLYLTSYLYPEMVASGYIGGNIREALCGRGCRVELFAPCPSRGVSPAVYDEYKRRRDEWELGGNLHIHRFVAGREPKGPVGRALHYFWLCFVLFCKALFHKDAKKCDVLFLASTPPVLGCVAALVKMCRSIPFVYNLQDIFPDSLVSTGLAKRNGLLWRVGRVIENFTYRHADKIIVISEDFKRNIMAKGVPEEKIEVVYNWVDQRAVVDVPRAENKLFDVYGLDRSKFYLSYCGNIGLTQNMDLLLEVMDELKAEYPAVQLVLVGEGAYKKEVERVVEAKSLSNVRFLPFQPYEDISLVFSLGDVGLVISKPGVGVNSVPSKTWSILSASRPVLASFDGDELRSVVEHHQCGLFTMAGDKEALREAVITLYQDAELRKAMGENGRRFILQNLTREVGAERYSSLICGVAAEGSHS